MKAATLKFRRTRQDAPAGPESEEEPKEPALSWTGGSAVAAKAITYLLISCLFAGPLALLGIGWLVFASSGPAPAPVVAGDTSATVDERAAVEAFAEDFVVTWLTSVDGQEKQLAPFLDDYSSVTLPKVSWTTSGPATAGIAQAEDGTWSVTVAVSVAAPKKKPAVRRYFQVPVTYAGGAMVASALPAPVAGPAVATPARLDYRHRATTADSVTVAATQFLAAMLAGSGDLTRFISPGASIAPIVPAPYTAIEVEDVLVNQELTEADVAPETGRTLKLLLTATATATADQQISVTYALTMTAREGRWEVSSVDPTPTTLAEEAPAEGSGVVDDTQISEAPASDLPASSPANPTPSTTATH